MLKFIIVCLIGIIMLQSAFALEKVNDFRLENMEGKRVSLSQFQEKGLVVLDFWALWCSPCKAFMPKLNELHKKYEKLNVVTINIDKPRALDRAKTYVRSNRFDFEVLFDTNQTIQKRFNITSIPRTILVEPDGNVIYDHTGYQSGDEKKLEEIIMNWCGVNPAPSISDNETSQEEAEMEKDEN
jgi:cytochrome c biogenesis protein CcmG, thiol:disulfide interchange protein DsbE